MKRTAGADGFSMIELVISLGLISIIFGGIFFSYSSVLDVLSNAEIRTSAVSALNREVEIIRNMPYDQVGVQGGFPAGALPYLQNIAMGRNDFLMKTSVRNIDDPFDGTLGGVPNDTAPADYKLVELEVSCPRCVNFVPLALTTTVAPKNLESTGNNGSLFVNVFNAQGAPIPGAEVTVSNTKITPTIEINDTTNNEGILQLVGLPTSTQGYRIYVSGDDYSSDRTYALGDPENPNPVTPDATVAVGTLTTVSFSIDRVSRLNFSAKDVMCSPTPNLSFSLSGNKIIGTGPNILKFSTTTQTDAAGLRAFDDIEWDTYSFGLMSGARYLRGTNLLSPAAIAPNSVVDISFTTAPAVPNGLLVTVENAAGASVPGASVEISKAGFSAALTTGREDVSDTDWSGLNYSYQSGNVDEESAPGTISLKALASSTYATGTVEYLVSRTFDFGPSAPNFYTLTSTPASQPAETGPDSVRFQVAVNNDDATWFFAGPDGTANTYYSSGSSALNELLSGSRYLRYKVFLKTADPDFTPAVNDVTVRFGSSCVPPGQVLFTGLAEDTYDILITAAGYGNATATLPIASGFNETKIVVTPQ